MRDLKRSDLWKNIVKEDPEMSEHILNICKYAFNEVEMGHMWAVDWKRIRDILVRGIDKHNMFQIFYKVQSDDDHTLHEANEWIKKNNFHAFTDDYIELGDSAGIHYEKENDQKHCSKKH